MKPIEYSYWRIVWYFILLILSLIIAGSILLLVREEKPLTETNGGSLELFYYAPRIPYFPESYTLGAKIEAIIECESNGNPNAQNPTSSAYGLCQFLDSTWEYVQNKWNMKLDRDDPEDQLYACKRLYREEGEKHWEESRKCWGE